jgi:hypothetical protein
MNVKVREDGKQITISGTRSTTTTLLQAEQVIAAINDACHAKLTIGRKSGKWLITGAWNGCSDHSQTSYRSFDRTVADTLNITVCRAF